MGSTNEFSVFVFVTALVKVCEWDIADQSDYAPDWTQTAKWLVTHTPHTHQPIEARQEMIRTFVAHLFVRRDVHTLKEGEEEGEI